MGAAVAAAREAVVIEDSIGGLMGVIVPATAPAVAPPADQSRSNQDIGPQSSRVTRWASGSLASTSSASQPLRPMRRSVSMLAS